MTEISGRRLVLFLDGTWNNTYKKKFRADGEAVYKPSNVLKLARAVLPRDSRGVDQVVYYDSGVGALARFPGYPNKLLHQADKYLGGAGGAGFEANIEDALHFLAHNYKPGDEVFLFGFSRGASTARGITRFISWCGGLPVKSDVYYLPQLFRAYIDSRSSRPSAEVIAEINAHRSRKKPRPPLAPANRIPVRFLGVWDTVMALGSRFKAVGKSTSTASHSFYVGAEPADCVLHAQQALAVDEQRFDFRPEIWQRTAGPEQTLAQRWFAGAHSAVGGGYVDDGLANIALRWILEGAEGQGLEVDRKFIGFYRPFAQDRLYESKTLKYKILDGIRRRKGARSLVGLPATANLSLDRTVIRRIQADPEEKGPDGNPRFLEMEGTAYRPGNVFAYLAAQPDLDAYLESLGLDAEERGLPEDVIRRIEKLRKA